LSRLKFVVKSPLSRLGMDSWILTDLDGNEIVAFSYYCKKMLDFSLATRKRYAEVIANFLDYLIAAGAFGVPATRRHINSVLDAYPHILASGGVVKLEQIQSGRNPEDAWLIPVLETLDIAPLAEGSFDNTLAAINMFLNLSEKLAAEAFHEASLLGIDHQDNHRILFEALERDVQISPREMRNMRQNSMLGSVIRFRSNGVSRPRGLHKKSKRTQDYDPEYKAFPFELVLALATGASTYRDRAFWLLLAASGLRTSEVKAMRWDHIAIATQEILVMDPHGLRSGRDIKRQDVLRFKGRATSFTFLIYKFKVAFFEALELYVRHEYIPPRTAGPHYIFQYVETVRRGDPFIDVSDAALLKNFRNACKRASIPPRVDGTTWAPHSLRHMYAIYMHNDFPVGDGTRGLSLAEVQTLMGHKDVIATAIYARKKRDQIRRKLEISDRIMMADSDDFTSLPLLPN